MSKKHEMRCYFKEEHLQLIKKVAGEKGLSFPQALELVLNEVLNPMPVSDTGKLLDYLKVNAKTQFQVMLRDTLQEYKQACK